MIGVQRGTRKSAACFRATVKAGKWCRQEATIFLIDHSSRPARMGREWENVSEGISGSLAILIILSTGW